MLEMCVFHAHLNQVDFESKKAKTKGSVIIYTLAWSSKTH